MQRIINFFKAILGICATKPLNQDVWNIGEEGNMVHVNISALSESCEKGAAVYLKGQGLQKPILLVRTEGDQYLAFSNSCTRCFLHRRLDPVPGEDTLRCCCIAHATFDYEGNPISESAKEPLTRYKVDQDKEELLINLGATEAVEAEVPEAVAAE